MVARGGGNRIGACAVCTMTCPVKRDAAHALTGRLSLFHVGRRSLRAET